MDNYTPRTGLTRRQLLGTAGLTAGGLVIAACGSDDDSGGTTAAPDTAASDTAAPDTAAPDTAAPDTEAPAGTDAAAASGEVPKTTISNVTLGYNNPNTVLRAPIFVGQSLGFFEEVGITGLEVNDADDAIGPLISGSFTLSLLDSDVLFGFNEEENPDESIGLRMVGLNQGSQPLVMIANEGITAENLGGKKVGGARAGSVNEAISKYILSQLGYNWETDVEFTTLTGGSNDWVTAMLSGQIDATVAFPRHIALAEAEGGSALYQDFLSAPQAGFAASQAVRDEDPGFTAAWNYAWIKSQRFCKTQANKDEVIQILADDWQIEVPPNLEQVYGIVSTIMTADNGFDPAEMDAWMDFIGPYNDVPDDINARWRNYFDVSGLHVAQEALGLPPNPSSDLSTGTTTTENL